MKVFESFDQFWQQHNSQPTETGFDRWTVAKFTHTDDQAYADLRTTGRDTLGYQPTLLTIADPICQQSEEIVLKNVPSETIYSLQQQYRERFIVQLPYRFNLFHSDKKQADAVYDSWEEFAGQWLERDGQNLTSYNLPLLFDHVSDLEYWSWQQKNFNPCGTQRLIVTVFQFRTGRFAEIFITNVNDSEMERIKLLIRSRLALQSEQLF